ncbi:hypothetical protein AB0K18_42840 [Nonomuraea sp. NPDC049421]|uniref:hypothetical protein n=1 Tax=Nonomuraea sp. NPDC049421 TaxID=3155275 RepID=UPI0034181AD6
MTFDEALANATRLLSFAEADATNLALMERLESLADSWLSVAALITERERV